MHRTLPLLAGVLWLAACATSDNVTPEAGGTAAPVRQLVPEGIVAAADGLDIAYSARGAGDTTLVFVHCWACDRSFWHQQIDVFAKTYQVVALDLPGHGESGAKRDDWSIAGLADDVRMLVEGLDLGRVILVGHSMGGPVSLLAAALVPDRVIGVVLVDTVHNAELAWSEEDAAPIVAAFREDFEGTNRQFVPMMFPPEPDPDLVAWVTKHANATHQTAAIALMTDFPNLDLTAILSAVDVPVRASMRRRWDR